MVDTNLLIALPFLTLAVAHSVLGERSILQPLFAGSWSLVDDVPRWAMEKILRFAWHLTSITWLGIAAIFVGGSVTMMIGVISLVSAVLIFVMLRGHLAWPLFLIAGLAAFRSEGILTDGVAATAGWVAAVVLLAASALHVSWVLRSNRWLEVALPTRLDAEPTAVPGRLLTGLVAAALATTSGLVMLVLVGTDAPPIRWLLIAAIAVLALRAAGDGRYIGLSKSVRGTPFAAADDRIFTPLVVFLALGSLGALVAA